MLKVAVVGLGTISPIHLYAIEKSNLGELVCVCDINESKREGITVPFYTDMKEMIEKETFDCVHLCLPHYLHGEAIKLFASHKINIFTEKPVALSYDEAAALFELEEGFKIGVCLQNRYNETTVALKELLDSKKYGAFKGMKAMVTWCRTQAYYDESPWRATMKQAGGGVMINQTIHTLDLMQYIAGEFASIKGLVGNLSLPDIEVEDTVSALAVYKNGGTGLFFGTNAYCTNSSVEMEIICEDAVLRMMDSKCYVVKEGCEPELICEDGKLEGSKHYYGASHFYAIEKFYQAMIDDTMDYISLEEGAKSLKIINDITQSA